MTQRVAVDRVAVPPKGDSDATRPQQRKPDAQERITAVTPIDATMIDSSATARESATCSLVDHCSSRETARGRHPGRVAPGRGFADPFLRLLLACEQ
jgi:hypothetical protein